MRVSMTMNGADFGKVLARVAEHSERTYPAFLNGQGLRLASFAMRETRRADANKIAWSLGQTGLRTKNKRTGGDLKKAVRQFSNSSKSINLYRLVNWRRVRVGKKPLGGMAMSKPARKMRGASLRSTGFIAGGWVQPIKGLAAAVGYADFKDSKPVISTRMSGKPKGWVNPAKPAISSRVQLTMGNTALLAESAKRTGSRKGDPFKVGYNGLAKGRHLTARDMMDHLNRKLAPVFKKFQPV